MQNQVVNLRAALARIDSFWSPRIVARLNDYQLKLVRLEGEFVWHRHPDTDEVFIVLDGELEIELPETLVRVGEGELFVVPRGMQHRPRAARECRVLLIEPENTPNTGDAGGERTVDAQWL